MAERVQTARTSGESPAGSRARMEAGLRIDRDDLDDGLIEQPGRYYQVAAAHAEAVAARDAAKLDFEELQANIDVELRAGYDERGEKTTEARIQQEIKLDARYAKSRKHQLDAQAEVDRLAALKEAYQQRSFMLRELVALAVSERGDQAGAAGAYEARARRVQEAETLRGDALRRRRPVGGSDGT